MDRIPRTVCCVYPERAGGCYKHFWDESAGREDVRVRLSYTVYTTKRGCTLGMWS